MAKKTIEKVDIKGLPIEAVVEALCKKYGANTLALASRARGLKLRLLSTGVYALDIALGGGVPENRITEIFGSPSALKSTVTMNLIASFQRRYPEGQAYLEDGEESFDPAYSELCGVDNDRLGLINGDSGEQAIDVISNVIDNNVPVLVVIDSIASLVPLAELECSAEQQHQGLHPRLIGKLMRILTRSIKRNLYDEDAATTTVVATNQTREKTGVIYGNPEFTPGGKAKDFYFSVRMKFLSSKSDSIMETVTANGVERSRRMGQKVRFEINKNKVASTQFEDGEFNYFIRPYKGHRPFSFDNEEVLFKYGVFFGLIKRSDGKKKDVFTFEDLSFAEAMFKAKLIVRPKLQRKLLRLILAKLAAENREGLSLVSVDTAN